MEAALVGEAESFGPGFGGVGSAKFGGALEALFYGAEMAMVISDLLREIEQGVQFSINILTNGFDHVGQKPFVGFGWDFYRPMDADAGGALTGEVGDEFFNENVETQEDDRALGFVLESGHEGKGIATQLVGIVEKERPVRSAHFGDEPRELRA
jgi:hypothetical protein